MTTAHKISGSEVLTRDELLPGYAAFRLGATKPWQWRWRHTTMVFSLMVAGLTVAGTNGLLP